MYICSSSNILPLNFELFIAKRIISSQPDKKNKTKPLVGTAILAISLGLAVMIISVAILTGFKKEITDKLVGFSSHIQITNLDNNSSFETEPILATSSLINELRSISQIEHFHPFAIKAGIISTKTEMQGIVLKGIDNSYHTAFLESFLQEGEILKFSDTIASNKVLISRTLSNLLKLRVGDKMPTYFIQTPPAARPFIVGGIYDSGLEEYDLKYIFCDIRHIQKVNSWSVDQITGFEIILKDDKDLVSVAEDLSEFCVEQLATGSISLDVQTVKEISPGFFDFLRLTDTNVWVILTLMILVSGFNMISGLFILILNRTNMIGILKALGADNQSLRKIFLVQASFIIGIGLALGNLIGIALCMIQDFYKVIPLDPGSYFVDAVPINIQGIHVVSLNIGTLILTIAMLFIPSGIISRISPAKTIKFD